MGEGAWPDRGDKRGKEERANGRTDERTGRQTDSQTDMREGMKIIIRGVALGHKCQARGRKVGRSVLNFCHM